MHASKDSMWREILKKFCKILGTKQALSLSRQGMAMAVFTSLCSSQSFHSHSRSPTRYSSLSLGNGADVLAVEPPAAMEDDAWNWGPIRLMAGASMMVSISKLGRQHRPSGSWVQQGRFCSHKYLRLLNSTDAGAHIQFGSWRPTYPPLEVKFSMQVGGQSFSRTSSITLYCLCCCPASRPPVHIVCPLAV